MAKFDSIIKFTGNLDGIVGMKGANGQTYIRKNVNPTQPNTEKQVKVRSKMSLAGQISKLTPREAIVGLGSSARERRSNYMKNIIKGANTEPIGEQFEATLEPEKLIFSNGLKINALVKLNQGDQNGIDVTITQENVDLLTMNGAHELMVVAVHFDSNRLYTGITTHFIAADTSASMHIPIFGDAGVNIYTIPVLLKPGATRADYDRGVEELTQGSASYTTLTTLIAKSVISLGASRFQTQFIRGQE